MAGRCWPQRRKLAEGKTCLKRKEQGPRKKVERKRRGTGLENEKEEGESTRGESGPLGTGKNYPRFQERGNSLRRGGEAAVEKPLPAGRNTGAFGGHR